MDEEISQEEVESAISNTPSAKSREVGSIPMDLPLREAREQFERAYLLQQFKDCEGNVARLAERVIMGNRCADLTDAENDDFHG